MSECPCYAGRELACLIHGPLSRSDEKATPVEPPDDIQEGRCIAWSGTLGTASAPPSEVRTP